MGEIRFVDTGETRGYPYLVCKKSTSTNVVVVLYLFGYKTGIYLFRMTKNN